MLKSIWLEGKRNRCMDHLIHVLVDKFMLEIDHHYKQQTLGMEGPNLSEKRHQKILTCAPETPIEKIKKIDNSCFEVESSNSERTYEINLDPTACSCSNFPCIWLCKHIVAVVHFFGGADLGPQPPVNAASKTVMPGSLVQAQVQGTDDRAAAAAAASIDLAINEIVALVNKLHRVHTKVPSDRENAKSLVMIGSWLKTFLHSVTAIGDPLPEKENIGPNQYSWPETAMQMGVKCSNKHRMTGKVDSRLTAQHIGKPNHKRPADNNPYGAGEQSSKRAKPDACSVVANERARAAEQRARTQPALKAPSASQPMPTTLPQPGSYIGFSFHAPRMYNPYNPYYPMSQPTYSYS